MPSYDYECALDGFFEESHAMGQAPSEIDCQVCGGKAHRRFSAPGIEFKGRGWGSKP